MAETLEFKSVVLRRFKAFSFFKLTLGRFNILVGPNNSGKSTILTAFRILAAALRRATRYKPQFVTGPDGTVLGHVIPLGSLSIGEENLFFNYDDSEPASVTFSLAGDKRLLLYFSEPDSCVLIPDDPDHLVSTPARFRSSFNCPIGFVPILGPVEQREKLYKKEAARLALFNYRAARNFRNIWYHYPEQFEAFRDLLQQTWPGMDIEPPKVSMAYDKTVLHMFCPEQRFPRELFWTGFGFQVWCQMLTHIVQSRSYSIFLIDEPDIYLHSDLQRQLLSILEDLGPDILIATHSPEIVSEAEPNYIVLIDKNRKSATRVQNIAQLHEVFSSLGSNLNPTLTQLAKTRCAVFVEGDDFRVFSRFAKRLGLQDLSHRSGFAVIPIGGFKPDKVRSLKEGIEMTLGKEIRAVTILDRDFRSDAECSAVKLRCESFCDLVFILPCKEVENFLLVPSAMDRATQKRISQRERRTGISMMCADGCSAILDDFASRQKSYIQSQFIDSYKRFNRLTASSEHETVLNRVALDELELDWCKGPNRKLQLIPAKKALSAVNQELQEEFGVSVTPTAIIDSMHMNEIPTEVRCILESLADFVRS